MDLKFGYKAFHERYTPNDLLSQAILAEKCGFDSIWASDHFHPWAHTGASAGFAWTWMASVAERTKTVRIGTGVTAPILRYNPAIVAQCFATLDVMYPDRIFLGLGTGEALNEVPVGYDWPSYRERVERLEEAITVIRKLWTKDFVSFKGKYFRLRKANLYTKPKRPLPIYLASFGPTVAEMAGKYADGWLALMTSNLEYYRGIVFPALERGARQSGRNVESIEKAMEIVISYDEDYDKAIDSLSFWRGAMLPVFYKHSVYDPREIEACGEFIGREALAKERIVVTNMDDAVKRIEPYVKLGFTHLCLCSSSPDQSKFIRAFGERAIPSLKDAYGDK